MTPTGYVNTLESLGAWKIHIQQDIDRIHCQGMELSGLIAQGLKVAVDAVHNESRFLSYAVLPKDLLTQRIVNAIVF